MAGTAAQCGCGGVVQIPAARAPAPQAHPQQPFAQQTYPQQAYSPAAGSLLDELTQRDFQAPAAAATSPAQSQQARDAELLRKYALNADVGPQIERPRSIMIYCTFKMIGIFFDGFGLFGLSLVFFELVDLGGRTITIPTPAFAFLASIILFVMGLNTTAVIGMFNSRPWGWYVAAFSYAFWLWGSIGSVFVGLAGGQVGNVCGNILYFGYAISVLFTFTTEEVCKYFQLKMNPWIGMAILVPLSFVLWMILGVVMVVAGIGLAMSQASS